MKLLKWTLFWFFGMFAIAIVLAVILSSAGSDQPEAKITARASAETQAQRAKLIAEIDQEIGGFELRQPGSRPRVYVNGRVWRELRADTKQSFLGAALAYAYQMPVGSPIGDRFIVVYDLRNNQQIGELSRFGYSES